MKRLLLILGVALCTFILGDAIFILTSNGLLANWGPIIVPSFISGILVKAFIEEDKVLMSKLIPGTVMLVKFLLFVLSVKSPTLLAIILIIFIYSFVSYVFYKLGLFLLTIKSKQ